MEWIKKLKIGDNVIMESRYSVVIAKVVKINKATVKLNNNILFYIKNACEYGACNTYGSSIIKQTTKESVENLQRNIRMHKMKKYIKENINCIEDYECLVIIYNNVVGTIEGK